MRLIAYHNKQSEKDEILAQLARHRKADEIIKGQYWEGGKGCAVGCTIHSGKHMEYEPRFGIPVMLARLEDCIFEGLPNEAAKEWPELFMSAIEPGQDLSLVGWKFLHWILTDEKINPGINHYQVRDAVKQCADIIQHLAKGNTISESAAWSAESACCAESAWSAESAAASARSAARSAAWSAESAAASARRAADSARRAADSARSPAYQMMADKLIFLIKRSPRCGLERRER